jgi:hypothetical protein
MSTRDTMELKEEAIRAQYEAALGMVFGLRSRAAAGEAFGDGCGGGAVARGSGRGRRSGPPCRGWRHARRRGRAGCGCPERVEGLSDGLVSPVQAAVLNALRRSLAIALAMGETFSAQSGLAELKKANLEGRVPEPKRAEFGELLQGEALVVLFTFANALAYLIAPHVGPGTVELGEVEEVLTDNAPLALQGALWELDQDIGALATDDVKLVAVVSAFAEALDEEGADPGGERRADVCVHRRVVEGGGGRADHRGVQAGQGGEGRLHRHGLQAAA